MSATLAASWRPTHARIHRPSTSSVHAECAGGGRDVISERVSQTVKPPALSKVVASPASPRPYVYCTRRDDNTHCTVTNFHLVLNLSCGAGAAAHILRTRTTFALVWTLC